MKISELLTESPLPNDWDPAEFSTTPTQQNPRPTTFKARLAYALERAKRLGSGSSRVAVIIEYEGRPTVLKIAKNAKGMAQNQAEADILEDGYISQMDICIPMIDYDKVNKQPTWIQTELAQKATEQKLCQLMKCEDLYDLVDVALDISGQTYSKQPSVASRQIVTSRMLKSGKYTEADIEIFNHYVDELATVASSSDVQLADFKSAGNWGIYQGRPVLIDLGFTSSVKDQHYSPKPFQRGW